jgi:Flp pilus assembly protein TadD
MAKLKFQHPEEVIEARSVALLTRARRFRLKGEVRKAIVALREACLVEEENAVVWTIYGHMLAESGRVDEARKVLSQAVWLRRAAGDEPRRRSTQRIIDRLTAAAA